MPPGGLGWDPSPVFMPVTTHSFSIHCYRNMLATDFAAYGLPRSLRKPRVASSFETLAQRQLPALGPTSSQLTCESDCLRMCLTERLPSLAPSLSLPLALSGCRQFRNTAGLLELSYGPQHLAHQNGGGRVLGEKIGCGCRNDRDAKTLEHVIAGELHGEVAGEPIWRLYKDCLSQPTCALDTGFTSPIQSVGATRPSPLHAPTASPHAQTQARIAPAATPFKPNPARGPARK